MHWATDLLMPVARQPVHVLVIDCINITEGREDSCFHSEHTACVKYGTVSGVERLEGCSRVPKLPQFLQG